MLGLRWTGTLALTSPGEPRSVGSPDAGQSPRAPRSVPGEGWPPALSKTWPCVIFRPDIAVTVSRIPCSGLGVSARPLEKSLFLFRFSSSLKENKHPNLLLINMKIPQPPNSFENDRLSQLAAKVPSRPAPGSPLLAAATGGKRQPKGFSLLIPPTRN